METETLREVVLWTVVVAHAYTAILKALGVFLMSSNQEKTELDRAIIANQAALGLQYILWVTVLVAPGTYKTYLYDWSALWIIVSIMVALSVTWVLRCLWIERIGRRMRAWNVRRRWRSHVTPLGFWLTVGVLAVGFAWVAWAVWG